MEIFVTNCTDCPFRTHSDGWDGCFFPDVDDFELCEKATDPKPPNCPLISTTVTVKPIYSHGQAINKEY